MGELWQFEELLDFYEYQKLEKQKYKELLRRASEDVVMRKACINEIKELTPYLQNIGDKYLVNTYSVQHIGEREFEGECKVIDFIGPKHALVSVTIKQNDMPEAKGLRIMKVDDGKM